MNAKISAVCFLAMVSMVAARPEPPSYNYPRPTPTNYLPPTPQAEYGVPSLAPVIHKHVYVHVAPPEPDFVPTRAPLPVQPPQKHYKIVFIKAPSPPSYQPPVIPVQPQNEEKTLVYVLVKKPEEQQDVVIPTAAPTQPSKPEVYFIRYKTQKKETGPYPDAKPPTTQYGPPQAEDTHSGY